MPQSDQIYRAIGESIDYGIWICDAQGRNIYASDSFLKLVGMTQQQCSDFGWGDVLHPDDAAATIDAWQRCSREGLPWEREHRFRGVDGKWHHVLARGVPIRDADGQITCWAGINLDIDEFKRQQHALAESEKQLRLAVTASPLVLHQCDAELRYTWFSHEPHPDFPLDRLLGRRPEEVHPPHIAGPLVALKQRVLDSGVGERQEVEFETSLGCQAWDMTVEPRRDEAGRIIGLMVAAVEVTERRRVAEALRESNQTLEQRVEERTAQVQERNAELARLATQLSAAEQRERRRIALTLHDHLQQLLVAAKYGIHQAADERMSPKLAAAMEQLDSLLGEAIASSRSLAVELAPPILYERGLLAALEWLGRHFEEKHHLRVELVAHSEVEPNDDDVVAFVFQAVRELLFNVIKHGGVREARLVITEPRAGWLALEVADDGAGCNAQQLFSARAEQPGFGLFHIKQRLRLLGGDFVLISQPRAGCRALMTLPMALTATSEMPPPEHPAAGSAGPSARTDSSPSPAHDSGAQRASRDQRPIRVLLVDDHKVLREGLARLLHSDPRIDVVGQAADGVEAIIAVQKLNPDVIVMDVTMPRMDGITATRQICVAHPRTKVVALSMHEPQEMGQAMRDAGAIDFIRKDGPADALVRAVIDAAAA